MAREANGLELEAPDVLVYVDGTVCLLFGNTEAGKAWLDENLEADAPTMGQAYACETRYVPAILDGACQAGLSVSQRR